MNPLPYLKKPMMLFNIPIPPSFSRVKNGKALLLLKEEFKDILLQKGVCDFETFFKTRRQGARYLTGRTPHPSLPLTGEKRMVMRQYSHGGLLRAFTRNLYLFGSRSFRELSLTEEVRSSGIPTIEPIGAVHQSVPPFFYRAYLLSLEIPEALNLVQYLQEMQRYLPQNLLSKRKTIRAIGLLLRQFHDAGFFHRDLQLKNILVVGDRPLLIDFDRSYRKTPLSIGGRMKNLLRLNRSAEKWRQGGLSLTRTDRWRLFSAYAKGDEGILKTMERIWRTYPLRLFFYRCSWAFRRFVEGKLK
jgi:3-deoxy-D-manno-octulosonic acid kinase